MAELYNFSSFEMAQSNLENENWTTVIKPRNKLFEVNLKEIWGFGCWTIHRPGLAGLQLRLLDSRACSRHIDFQQGAKELYEYGLVS